MRASASLLVLVVVGCHTPPEVVEEELCTIACDCIQPSTLPADQDACVGKCVSGMNTPPPQDCITCIEEHAGQCASIFDCDEACSHQTPLLGGGPR